MEIPQKMNKLVDRIYQLNMRIKALEEKLSNLKGELLEFMNTNSIHEIPGMVYPVRAIVSERILSIIDPEVIHQVEWDMIKKAISIKSTEFDKIAKFNPSLYTFKKVEGTSKIISIIKK